MGGPQLLRVRPAAITGATHLLKDVADRAAAAFLLVLFAPLLLTLALLVRRDSPGPALYRQTRVGRHGRLFTVFKLRTMRQDADAVVHELATPTSPTATACCSRSVRTRASPGSGRCCASTRSTSCRS